MFMIAATNKRDSKKAEGMPTHRAKRNRIYDRKR